VDWWVRLRRRRSGGVSFCDRCGVVCDRACRRDRLRGQAFLQALAYRGWRL
jgi:hypothetical protein